MIDDNAEYKKGFELPPHLALYGNITRYIELKKLEFSRKETPPHEEDINFGILYRDSEPRSADLNRLGVDAVQLNQLYVWRPELIFANLEMFANGVSHPIEGDAESVNMTSRPGLYYLYIGAEAPPSLVQAEQYELAADETHMVKDQVAVILSHVKKHILNDEESTILLDLIRTQEGAEAGDGS